MTTCCVCKHHFDPAVRGMSNECPRCNSDNTVWEQVRHKLTLDALGDMGLLWLVPGVISIAQILLAFYFSALDRRLAPFAFLIVVCCLSADALIAMVTFVLRFRIREYAQRRNASPGTKQLSLVALMVAIPVFSSFGAFLILVTQEILLLAMNDKPVGLPDVRHALYSYLITTPPDIEMILSYIFFTGVFFSATLLAVRRYVDSLDLPMPIFVTVPLLRDVAFKEFLGNENSAIPKDAEYTELNRTAKGGLSMTVGWKAGNRTRKVKIECDQWAHLVSAKDEEDRS